jgi:hypothetical protein
MSTASEAVSFTSATESASDQRPGEACRPQGWEFVRSTCQRPLARGAHEFLTQRIQPVPTLVRTPGGRHRRVPRPGRRDHHRPCPHPTSVGHSPLGHPFPAPPMKITKLRGPLVSADCEHVRASMARSKRGCRCQKGVSSAPARGPIVRPGRPPADGVRGLPDIGLACGRGQAGQDPAHVTPGTPALTRADGFSAGAGLPASKPGLRAGAHDLDGI